MGWALRMIDIVNIKGKKVIFIDELSFGFPLDIGLTAHQDDDIHPSFQIDFSFRKPEKLGQRIAY